MSLPAAPPQTEAADCLLVFHVCEVFFLNVYTVFSQNPMCFGYKYSVFGQ